MEHGAAPFHRAQVQCHSKPSCGAEDGNVANQVPDMMECCTCACSTVLSALAASLVFSIVLVPGVMLLCENLSFH